eukprot:747256-Hanusia_phi.AAC.3
MVHLLKGKMLPVESFEAHALHPFPPGLRIGERMLRARDWRWRVSTRGDRVSTQSTRVLILAHLLEVVDQVLEQLMSKPNHHPHASNLIVWIVPDGCKRNVVNGNVGQVGHVYGLHNTSNAIVRNAEILQERSHLKSAHRRLLRREAAHPDSL